MTKTDITYSAEQVQDLMKRYPAFLLPLLNGLENPTLSELHDTMRARIAVNISDTATLANVLGLTPKEFGNFYPDMQPVSPSTDDTISSFLDRFGSKNGSLPDELPEFAPSVWIPGDDLTPIEEVNDNSDTESTETEAVTEPSAPENDRSADPELTMSLAAAMIKSRDYQGALKIITDLNLKNPEKSIYFADQIRFLRKLIINESKNNRNK